MVFSPHPQAFGSFRRCQRSDRGQDGGGKKRGILFAPRDALEEDPVVLKYAMGYVDKVEVLKEDSDYRIGDIQLSTARKHQHRVETYGLNFKTSPHTLSFITDTKFFSELPGHCRGGSGLSLWSG
jgi:hypothetical protein